MRKQNLREIVEKSIRFYNKYRTPEAIAQLTALDDNEIKIKISGSFCETCGLYDWIEDLVYILKDHGIETETSKIIEPYDYYGDRIIILKIIETD